MITPGPSSTMNRPQPDHEAGQQDEGAPQAPFSLPVASMPSLTTAGTPSDRAARLRAIASIKGADAQTLVLRIATTTDPVVLWALHLRLDRLDVPPCQRWPTNIDNPQAEFVTLLADLLWLHRRLPAGHEAGYRGWRALLAQAPQSPVWHEHALRQFVTVARRGSLAHWCAQGLALTDAQRADTMMMPTEAMRASRRRLQPAALADLGRQLLDYAIVHPDRARQHTPQAVASRRLRLWRCWVLAGLSPGRAATAWAALTGEAITRQRLAGIVADVDDIARPRRRARRRSRT